MTYIVEKPAVSFAGIERPLITIEFAPKIHPLETEYSYEHPQFVFGDCVTLKNEYPETEYTVCALELIESKTPSGMLLNQPYWKYKITNGEVSFEKEETALFRCNNSTSTTTCSECQDFKDYQEQNGKGWCQCFDRQAKRHYEMTNDCILNGALKKKPELENNCAIPTQLTSTTEEATDELDKPYSPYQIRSIVKVIDPKEHHSEWGVFEVVQVKNNDHHFDDTDTYLNSSQWLYRLVNNKHENTYSKNLWVRENEICHFDESHLICTKDIF